MSLQQSSGPLVAPVLSLLAGYALVAAGCSPPGAVGGIPDGSADVAPLEADVPLVPEVGGFDAQLPQGCVEKVPARRTTGTILELPFRLSLGDAPLVFGESNPLPGGGTVTPLNVRYYVTSVALLRAGGEPVAVDLVTAAGAPLPYGIFLFNAEDAAAQTARVLAPPGAYTGVTFRLGISDVCNAGVVFDKNPPLTHTSQLTWPHGFGGYLFLRYEGRTEGISPSSSDKAPPPAIHMGGQIGIESALLVQLDGALNVPATGSPIKVVRLMMDQVFRGAVTPYDGPETGFPGAEIQAGERLRHAAAALRLFTFAP